MAIDVRNVDAPWLVSIEQDIRGQENMDRDVAMARACLEDRRPRLRIYSWSPWTLSLGHHQPEDNLNRRAIEENEWDVVRRPTGGRAVFHSEELTYAVAMPGDGMGIHATYASIVDAIRRGLIGIGAQGLEFSRSRPDFALHYRSAESASCFSASALNELTWNDRKILGSAQRRYDDVLLQHGSLLLGEAHLSIVDLLYPDASPDRRESIRSSLAARTVTLREVLGGSLPPFMIIAESIATAFEDGGISPS